MKALKLLQYLFASGWLMAGLLPLWLDGKQPYLSASFCLMTAAVFLFMGTYSSIRGVIPEIKQTSGNLYIHTRKFSKTERPVKYGLFLTLFFSGFVFFGFIGYAILQSTS